MTDKELMNEIKVKVSQIQADFDAGLITKEQHQDMFDLVDRTMRKIEAISTGRITP